MGSLLAGIARRAARLRAGREDLRRIARIGQVAAPDAKFKTVRQRESEGGVELIHRALELVGEAGREALEAIDHPRRAFIEIVDVENRAAEIGRASGRERVCQYV